MFSYRRILASRWVWTGPIEFGNNKKQYVEDVSRHCFGNFVKFEVRFTISKIRNKKIGENDRNEHHFIQFLTFILYGFIDMPLWVQVIYKTSNYNSYPRGLFITS